MNDDNELDVNDYITRGREGFLSFIVTGGSEVDDIKLDSVVFVDVLQEPEDGDIILWKSNGKNYIRRFDSSQKKLYLVGKKPNKDSHIKGVVIADLTFHKSAA